LPFFPINFNSTALFKNAFLGLDLAGRPFGGDFEQLSRWKMKKTNVLRFTFFAFGCHSLGSRDVKRVFYCLVHFLDFWPWAVHSFHVSGAKKGP
jgi:hypothetical protein